MVIRGIRSLLIALLAVLAAVAVAFTSTISTTAVLLSTTVLAMTGTFTSRPYPAYLDMVHNQFVGPALGPDYDYPIGVVTPEQAWPITGITDHTFGTSVAIGLGDLERAMSENGFPEQPLLIFGYSQSSVIWNLEKRRLAKYYAEHPEIPPPALEFMCIGCLNLPQGGVMARYPGAYIPLINFYFNGASPMDTPFPSTYITLEYDGFADSPLYPLLPLSTINGLLGMLYAHTEYDEYSIATCATTTPCTKKTYLNNTFYFFENDKLPLFGPLRTLGVPEGLIDIVEPFFKVVVDWGYDRDIPPWEPTPARLVPRIDPVKATADLVKAIDEGIDNALEYFGSPAPITVPAPVAARAIAPAEAPAVAPDTEAVTPKVEAAPKDIAPKDIAPKDVAPKDIVAKTDSESQEKPEPKPLVSEPEHAKDAEDVTAPVPAKDTDTKDAKKAKKAEAKDSGKKPRVRDGDGPRSRGLWHRKHRTSEPVSSADAPPSSDAAPAN